MKDLKQEIINKLEDRVSILQSIVDSQTKALSISIKIMDSKDARLELQRKLIDDQNELLQILDKHSETLQKENKRLNIAIGIFLLSASIFCAIKIITI